eukprot:363382-Chlamydomonas_euryale.AAC.2
MPGLPSTTARLVRRCLTRLIGTSMLIAGFRGTPARYRSSGHALVRRCLARLIGSAELMGRQGGAWSMVMKRCRWCVCVWGGRGIAKCKQGSGGG